VIYEYLPPGKYPVSKKKAKRKPGYYYYYPYFDQYYPVPFYYWYYYPQYSKYGYPPVAKKSELESVEIPEELVEEIESLYESLGLPKNPEKGQLEIMKVKDRWIVFQATGKKGFGAWKILKSFDNEDEAEEFVKKKKGKLSGPRTDEERAKAHFGISDEEWDKLPPEKKEEYIKKLPPRGSAKMAKEDKVKCPVCGKEFDSKEDMIEHFNKEHSDEYGEYGKGKYPEKKSLQEENNQSSGEENNPESNPGTNEGSSQDSSSSEVSSGTTPVNQEPSTSPDSDQAQPTDQKDESQDTSSQEKEQDTEAPVKKQDTPKDESKTETDKEGESEEGNEPSKEENIPVKKKEQPKKITIEEFLDSIKEASAEEKASIVADLLIRSFRRE